MSLRQRKQSNNTTDEDDSSPPNLVPESSSSSWDKCSDEDASHDKIIKNVEKESDNNEATKLALKETPPASPLDDFLSTYSTFSNSTFTADQGLKVLQWSSWAVAYLTRSPNNSSPNVISPALRKLYSELSMTRYALRFYGFFQSLEGYRSGSWAGGSWDNPLIGKIVKYLMCGSMMAYYPLEHVAYAGWQMPGLVRVDANRLSAISCGFWSAFIVGDFWVSCLKWRELKRKLSELGELLVGKKREDDKDAVINIQQEQKTILNKIRNAKLQALRSLLFILPAINWSLPKWATDPLLSEPVVNGLMLAESYTCIYQSLCNIRG